MLRVVAVRLSTQIIIPHRRRFSILEPSRTTIFVRFPGEKMADFHTVKSHGVKVLRFHMHDWLILVLLGVIEIILNVIEPFHRFVGVDMMTDLKYPMKENTIPFWAVPIVAGLLPIIVFIVYYIIKRDFYDLHHGILGILYSLLVTGVITDAIKDGVGRPRPDFFWRCFPDGKVNFDPVTKGVICTGIKSVIKEGHKSFPSGHTSWSFAGLGFFAWYISGKVRAFNQKGHVAKLCLVLLPLLAAALIAISRVDDYWHHWQDVFTGGLIGLIVASFCYLQFFPPPHHANGWGPRAYFQMLSDSQQSRAEPAALGLDTYPNELRTINVHPRNTIYSNSSASSTRDTYPILDGRTRS